MNQVLAAGAIEQLSRFPVRFGGRVAGGRTHFLERGTELTALLAIVGAGTAGLAHPLLG
jgi:hypothetical protein